MALPYEFDYAKPASLQDVLVLLAEKGRGARILAGGTDLANELKQGFRVPDVLIDIKGLAELQKIEIRDQRLSIGALVTFSDIRLSGVIRDHAYVLYEAAGLVASPGVRNRATMVGNICSAVACMDSASPLLVHNAMVHCLSMEGERLVPVQKWFVDNRKTLIKEKELVTHVSIPLSSVKCAGAYQKMMRYTGEDLAAANVGVLLFADGRCHVAFGSVGPTPKRSAKLESHFKTKGVNKGSIEEACAMLPGIIKPISDVRASKEYRMHMTKVMLERAVIQAIDRLKVPTLIRG
ncbi:MAG: xanthine dehydrogenase family protein subunit M [Bacteroidia bacterium]|nr:MAG: xanthine dehydrogenase family protein subunit M [Bacteroidia bacterium]